MFHTLFFADFYLGNNESELREQPFHQNNPELFADYEQLLPRSATSLYDKTSIDKYLRYCRQKAKNKIASETEQSLEAQADFPRRDFSRAELYVYNLRHVIHHAAQLTLRLRLDTDVDIPWVSTGWKETP